MVKSVRTSRSGFDCWYITCGQAMAEAAAPGTREPRPFRGFVISEPAAFVSRNGNVDCVFDDRPLTAAWALARGWLIDSVLMREVAVAEHGPDARIAYAGEIDNVDLWLAKPASRAVQASPTVKTMTLMAEALTADHGLREPDTRMYLAGIPGFGFDPACLPSLTSAA